MPSGRVILTSLAACTAEELRTLLRAGDGRERVDAAFALALKLGRQALADIKPALEGDPGVRAHWLTVLASFGEVAAVAAVAEHGETEAERSHALILAAQLGATDPAWCASVLPGVGTRTQAMMLELHRSSVSWTSATPVLFGLLSSDVPAFRTLAASELLQLFPEVGRVEMQAAALAHPEERLDLLRAWATGSKHTDLLRAAASNCRLEPLAAALKSAGRRYTLTDIAPYALACPALMSLLQLQPADPAFRLQFLMLFGTFMQLDRSAPPVAYATLAEAVPPPFAVSEEQVLAAWRELVAGEEPGTWAPGWRARNTAVWGLVALGLMEPPPPEYDEDW